MDRVIRSFIRSQNLRRYRDLLKMTAGESEREKLLKLIAEEEAKDSRQDGGPKEQ
jgi:hypothetical protein